MTYSMSGKSAFSGLFLLGIGYFFAISAVVDYGPFYTFLVHLFNWTLRAAGALLLAAAGLGMFKPRAGLTMDAVVSGLAGALLVVCVVGWTVFEKSADLYNIVIAFVALMLLRESYSGIMLFRTTPGEDRVQRRPLPPPEPARVISSSVLPKVDEPPPEGGYLAALAKEQDDQPGGPPR